MDDPYFKISMPVVESETWMPLLIRIFAATRRFTNFHDFFYELIHRGALEPQTIDNFLNLEELTDTEFELFYRAFKGPSARVAKVLSDTDDVGHSAELDPRSAMQKISAEIHQSAIDFSTRTGRSEYEVEINFLDHKRGFNHITSKFVGF